MKSPTKEKTKTTLSLSHWCRKVAKEMMRREGFTNFNQFVEHLIRLEWRRQQPLYPNATSDLPDPDEADDIAHKMQELQAGRYPGPADGSSPEFNEKANSTQAVAGEAGAADRD